MKRVLLVALSAAFLAGSLGLAQAQPAPGPREEMHPGEPHPGGEQRGGEQRGAPERHWQEAERHGDWRRGQPMPPADWERGHRVDFHEYGLREPPSGYEWREVDGAFVLGAIATGVITSIMMQGQ